MQKDFYLTSEMDVESKQLTEENSTVGTGGKTARRTCGEGAAGSSDDSANGSFALSSRPLWWGNFRSFTQAGFIAACSCCLHGESDLLPGTLNLALHVGDDPVKVRRNRQRFAAALGVEAARFTTCAQIHGSQVREVTEDLIGCGAVELTDTIADTDALITCLPDVPLLLFYADCTPVLLADPVTGAIGLAHAGWRGTAEHIAQKTVEAMRKRFGVRPETLLAAIGPCIGGCCYEVDDAVREKMPGQERFFVPRAPGHYQLDLGRVNRRQLEEAGLLSEHISAAEVCTCDNHELFFSYRYENGRTGRMGVCLCRKQG